MSKRLTYERARELFDYEPASGVLKHKTTRNNAVRIGSVAGTVSNRGYVNVRVDGEMYLAHRIIWLWMTGSFPENDIDHINRVRTDNRWSNLRAATRQQNAGNSGARSNSKSGIRGVFWNKQKKKWVARIMCQGARYHLGYFSTVEEANACYLGAASLIFGSYAHHQSQGN